MNKHESTIESHLTVQRPWMCACRCNLALQGIYPEPEEQALIKECTQLAVEHEGVKPKGWLGPGLSQSPVSQALPRLPLCCSQGLALLRQIFSCNQHSVPTAASVK